LSFIICNLAVNLAGFRYVWQNTRIHRAQSVTLWLAYRTGAVEQCCQML